MHLVTEKDHCNAVAALLEYGANANEQMSDGRIVLHLAAAKDCANCIKRLLAAKVDITITNNVGEMALYIIAEPNSCNALRLLRQWQDSRGTINDEARQSVYVNSQTQSGEMPLHYSARAGCEQCLKGLLEMGADITARDDNGRTALHIAAIGRRVTPAKKLCEENCVVNSTEQTSPQVAINQCTDDNAAAVHALLEANADIEVVDKEQNKPLQLAIKNDCSKIVDLLLLHNATIEKTDVDGASATIKAMLQKAQHQRAHIDDTVTRIVQMDKARKGKALNVERIKQGALLSDGAYGPVYAGVWHLPDIESEHLVPSVRSCSIRSEESLPERNNQRVITSYDVKNFSASLHSESGKHMKSSTLFDYF